MSGKTRCVFDTNVLISALSFPRSTPRKAFDLALGRGAILASEATLAELVQVLRRAKFHSYFTVAEREAFLRVFAATVELVEISERVTACRDSADDKFLEVSVCGHANYLISGDQDLLALKAFRQTTILRAEEFISTVSKKAAE